LISANEFSAQVECQIGIWVW